MGKIRSLAFGLLIFLAVYGNAQTSYPFPDSNAVWSELFSNNYHSGPVIYSSTNYACNGDTVIGNYTYMKIYECTDTLFNIDSAWYVGAIRKDTLRRIYYLPGSVLPSSLSFVYDTLPDSVSGDLPDSVELLLYDFDLVLWDTIPIKNPADSNQVITFIDSILVQGVYRKRYQIEVGNISNRDYWIEGIGSSHGLFTPLTFKLNWTWDLLCFKESDQNIYQHPSRPYCYWPVGIDNINLEHLGLNVYPNPFYKLTTIQIPKQFISKTTSIIIFDIYGREVKRIENITSPTLTLYKENLKSGLYIYKIVGKEGLLRTGKLIIQ